MKNYFAILTLLIFASCATPQKVIYFENASRFEAQPVIQNYVTRIQKDDLLSIVVGSKTPALAMPFNSMTQTENPQQGSSTTQLSTYLVSPDGEIVFPILGKLKVLGLTHAELSKMIEKMIIDGQYINEPTVTVKLMNHKISVLGEVNTPGLKSVASERITIFEAISLAGDLTIFGRRDNISIIREQDGKRVVAHVDINSRSIFDSEYYYLSPNDVIYVEPNKKKMNSSVNNPAMMSTIFSASSLLVTIINFLTR